MILPGSYTNGFAPRDGQPLYPELWRGCVGAWAPCLGPTGLTLRDWSGFGNHGTLTNGPTWKTSQGKHAIDLDGTDDDVRAVFQSPTLGTSSVSISAWCRLSRLESGSFRAVAAIGQNPSHWLFLGRAADNKFHVQAFDGSANPFASGTTTAVVGTLYHVMLTRAQNVMKLFVNGVEEASTADLTSLSNQPVVTLGNMRVYSQQWPGELFDVMVHRRVISLSEIRLLATRPGIAYEMAPRRRASVFLPSHLHYISGSAVRQGSIITGASPLGNVSKIQRAGDISPIPEERFDDRRYYYT